MKFYLIVILISFFHSKQTSAGIKSALQIQSVEIYVVQFIREFQMGLVRIAL
jgi:hypothetical protein